MTLFPCTRESALDRLERFLADVPNYAASRNFVKPGHENVSRLSAAIRHRLITEEEVVSAVLERHRFPAAEKFLQEVLWRGYWKAWLEARPAVWCDYLARALDDYSPEVKEKAEQTARGRSGSPIMDFFAQELRETGYLHNHARMWWASFWIHRQQLPWELGARHFLDHLLDGDAASNTLSWRWVAGLQTPGKSYVATAQNIAKYCDPAILEKAGGIGLYPPPANPDWPRGIFQDRELSPPSFPKNFPKPGKNGVILLHDEDLCLEKSPLADCRPARVLQFIPPRGNSLPPARAQWLEAARNDAAHRARSHFHCEVLECGSIAEIARACQNSPTLLLLAPFVGPLQDQLVGLDEALNEVGTQVIRRRRAWDTALQPYALRGFFPFWKKIAHILQTSGVEGLA